MDEKSYALLIINYVFDVRVLGCLCSQFQKFATRTAHLPGLLKDNCNHIGVGAVVCKYLYLTYSYDNRTRVYTS